MINYLQFVQQSFTSEALEMANSMKTKRTRKLEFTFDLFPVISFLSPLRFQSVKNLIFLQFPDVFACKVDL